MTKLICPEEARLPFPRRIVQLSNRTIEIYEIPYPFIHKPSIEEEIYDIHADEKFFGQSILF
jgi:hypothetical protein